MVTFSIPRVLYTLLALFPAVSFTQNVGTCSGKIKSDFKINYSKINIHLYTKSGSLYENSDCAPNNGYFVIPVYEKGDYLMKVSPPEGWGIEPSEVTISYDGETDLCSLNKDIIFTFIGFSISGQVNNVGQDNGPRGIKIAIKGSELLRETESTDNGFFVLPNILPGEYTVTGSHSTWRISETPIVITVTDDVIELPRNSILVEGYNVQGFIKSEGEPVAEVLFLLYVENSNNDQKQIVCDTSEVIPILGDNTPPPSCIAVSSKEGMFSFQSLPTGTYRIVPYYQSAKSMYQVSPSEASFTVINDSVTIEPNFEVHGFSVYGTVLQKEGGEGLSGANVIVNGELVTTTDSKGHYQLMNVTAGSYNIMFTVPSVEFDSANVSLNPSAPKIPDVYPSRYSVCGMVKISVNPLKPFQTGSCSVEVSSESDSASVVSSVDSTGLFCLMLAPGKYNLKIIVSDSDSNRGLVFEHSTLSVTVEHTPIKRTQLSFTQFTGELTINIKCLSVCGKLEVTLERLTDNNKSLKLADNTRPLKGEISFSTLLPGSYKVSLSSEFDATTCWKQEEQTVTIPPSGTHPSIDFIQAGFKMKITSTHDSDVKLILNKSSEMIKVLKGANTFCLEEHGDYSLLPKSCYVFDADMYMFMTTMPAPIEMEAIKHFVTGTVKAPKVSGLKVDIYFNLTQTDELKTPDRDANPVGENEYIYRYSFKASSGAVVVIRAFGGGLSCRPAIVHHRVGPECPESIQQFNCSKGTYLKGTIDPPLEGVAITVILSNGEEFYAVTNDKGAYEMGPMPADVSHTVEPVLDQFVFYPVSEDDRYNFKAVKKSRMTVQITDSISSPLNGTLISVNGEEFRSTEVANDVGSVTYNDLHPGEYYIKPILREYEFLPASQMIELLQGEDLTVNFTGIRVAFSVSGKVMSLNKTPLQGAIIQIKDENEKCKSFREISDENGDYKFRGIMPTCSYFVSIVTEEDNSIVETAIPRERYIQISEDVFGEDFVTILKPLQTIVTGNVVTPTTEHMNTLKVVVYSDKFMDSVLYTVTPDSMGFFTIIMKPDAPLSCYVQVETTLSSHYFTIETSPTQFSTANPSSHITLYFSAQPADASTLSQSRGSFLGILFAVGSVFLLFNTQKIIGSIQPLLAATATMKRLSAFRKTKRR